MPEILNKRGVIKSISKINKTRTPDNYWVSLLIDGDKFSMFGGKEELERKTAVLKPLEEVEFSYRVKRVDEVTVYRNIISIKPVKQKETNSVGMAVANRNPFAPEGGGEND